MNSYWRTLPTLWYTLTKLEKPPNAMTLSPSGTYLAIQYDLVLELWNVKKCKRKFKSYLKFLDTDKICLDFRNDDSLLLSTTSRVIFYKRNEGFQPLEIEIPRMDRVCLKWFDDDSTLWFSTEGNISIRTKSLVKTILWNKPCWDGKVVDIQSVEDKLFIHFECSKHGSFVETVNSEDGDAGNRWLYTPKKIHPKYWYLLPLIETYPEKNFLISINRPSSKQAIWTEKLSFSKHAGRIRFFASGIDFTYNPLSKYNIIVTLDITEPTNLFAVNINYPFTMIRDILVPIKSL